MLSGKKKKFADYIVKHPAASNRDAAIFAGCSKATASQAGSRLAKDTDVLEYWLRIKFVRDQEPLPTKIQIPKYQISSGEFVIKPGDCLHFEYFKLQLLANNYIIANSVTKPGDICIRGSIIDFFPFGNPIPCRIEFNDNSVHSIHALGIDSKISGESLTSITINKKPLFTDLKSKPVNLDDIPDASQSIIPAIPDNDPMKFLELMMNDTTQDPKLRKEAAVAQLPYKHKKINAKPKTEKPGGGKFGQMPRPGQPKLHSV